MNINNEFDNEGVPVCDSYAGTYMNDTCYLTVHFIQNKFISSEIQFSQVQVCHFSISLLLEQSHTQIMYAFI